MKIVWQLQMVIEHSETHPKANAELEKLIVVFWWLYEVRFVEAFYQHLEKVIDEFPYRQPRLTNKRRSLLLHDNAQLARICKAFGHSSYPPYIYIPFS